MPDYAKITHRYSRRTVTTTVKIPGRPPMSKTWRERKAGEMVLQSDRNWDEEPALAGFCEIAEAAMDFHDECREIL